MTWLKIAAPIVALLALVGLIADRNAARTELKRVRTEIATLQDNAVRDSLVINALGLSSLAQAQSAKTFGARIGALDATLSSALKEIANAPPSTVCATSPAIIASERGLHALAQAYAAPGRSGEGHDAGRAENSEGVLPGSGSVE